jgi:hypothetical protein
MSRETFVRVITILASAARAEKSKIPAGKE